MNHIIYNSTTTAGSRTIVVQQTQPFSSSSSSSYFRRIYDNCCCCKVTNINNKIISNQNGTRSYCTMIPGCGGCMGVIFLFLSLFLLLLIIHPFWLVMTVDDRTGKNISSLDFVTKKEQFMNLSSLASSLSSSAHSQQSQKQPSFEKGITPNSSRTIPDIDISQYIGCLEQYCIDAIATKLARAYPLRTDRTTWCLTSPGLVPPVIDNNNHNLEKDENNISNPVQKKRSLTDGTTNHFKSTTTITTTTTKNEYNANDGGGGGGGSHPTQQQQSSSSSSQTTPPVGLLLIKVPKSASSTSAGVTIRIAQRNNCTQYHWQHKMAYKYNGLLKQQNQQEQEQFSGGTKSNHLFKLTTVRDPAQRAISTIFFHAVSRIKNISATSENNENGKKQKQQTVLWNDSAFIRYLRLFNHEHQGAISEGQGGFTLRYIHPTYIPKYSVWTPNGTTTTKMKTKSLLNQGEEASIKYRGKLLNPEATIEHVRTVIQDTYDFILVPERMDESLVALALLLGIPVGDVLVTSSKVSSSSSNHNHNKDDQTSNSSTKGVEEGGKKYEYHLTYGPKNVYKCIPIIPSYTTTRVADYLSSYEWKAMNYGDYLLHATAMKSLDLTIYETIGYERFQREYQLYKQYQTYERTICSPHVQFPCSQQGVPQMELSKQNCYLHFYDFGCGYPCIDELIQNVSSSFKNQNHP